MLESRWPAVLAAVFAAALLWRLAYLGRLAASPLMGSLTEDSLIYWRWSSYLMQHGWWGKNAFFMGPLYPYWLALARPVLGDSVRAVLTVQAIWGAASAVLLADAARRVGTPLVGLIVGLLVATFEMAVFFDGLVLMESLLFFLEAVLVWCVVRTSWSAPRAAPLLIVGALIGLVAEGRASSSILLLPALVFLAMAQTGRKHERIRSAGLILAGFAIVATPAAVRNWKVSGEWIPFTYNGGFNLYEGNNPEATGAFTRIMGNQIVGASLGAGGEDGGVEADARDYLRKVEGVDLTPAASSAYWTRKAERYMAAHPSRTAGLAARKIGMMWNRREYPQIENVDEFRILAGPVGLPWTGTFGLIGILAVAGLLPAWRRGPSGRFLVGYAILMSLAVAPFFVTDRYRHHLVPAAMMLAAFALDELAKAWRSHRPAARRQVLASALAGVVIVNLPAPQLSPGRYAWSLASDLGTRWAEKGRLDRALPEYEKALRMEEAGVRVAAADRADLYYNYGNALARAGRAGEAVAWYRRAVQVLPDHVLALQALAQAQAAGGAAASAESLVTALEAKTGGHRLALESRARLAASQGRLDEAERIFLQIVREYPSEYRDWGALIRVQIQAGQLQRAARTLQDARAQGLPQPDAKVHEALLAALAHDRQGAERVLSEVPPEALRDPDLAQVAQVTRRLLSGP